MTLSQGGNICRSINARWRSISHDIIARWRSLCRNLTARWHCKHHNITWRHVITVLERECLLLYLACMFVWMVLFVCMLVCMLVCLSVCVCMPVSESVHLSCRCDTMSASSKPAYLFNALKLEYVDVCLQLLVARTYGFLQTRGRERWKEEQKDLVTSWETVS